MAVERQLLGAPRSMEDSYLKENKHVSLGRIGAFDF